MSKLNRIGNRRIRLSKQKRRNIIPDRKFITPVFTAMIALLSGAISAYLTYYIAEKRLKSEDSISRAEIFKTLLFEIRDKENDTYPLLALWKIYPNDRRLIVITALQDPSPETVSLLTQIGYKEELLDFKDDIKKIYLNSTGLKRSQVAELYESIDAPELTDILIDEILGMASISAINSEIAALSSAITSNKSIHHKISNLFENNNDISFEKKLSLSYVLYISDSKSNFKKILVDIQSDISLVPVLSAFLKGTTGSEFDPVDRSSILHLASKFVEEISSKDDQDLSLADYSVDLIEQFYGIVSKNRFDTNSVIEALKLVALNENQKLFARDRAINLINQYQYTEEAKNLYVYAILCAKEKENSRRAHSVFTSREFLFFDTDIESYENALKFSKGLWKNEERNCDREI